MISAIRPDSKTQHLETCSDLAFGIILGAKRAGQFNMGRDKHQVRGQVKLIVFTGFVLFATGLFVELVLLR